MIHNHRLDVNGNCIKKVFVGIYLDEIEFFSDAVNNSTYFVFLNGFFVNVLNVLI